MALAGVFESTNQSWFVVIIAHSNMATAARASP